METLAETVHAVGASPSILSSSAKAPRGEEWRDVASQTYKGMGASDTVSTPERQDRRMLGVKECRFPEGAKSAP